MENKKYDLAKCVCFNFRKATRVVTQIYDEKLRSSGLRATQLSILFVASVEKSTSITRLAEMLVVDRTTLTRNLKPLEKQDLIKIEPGNDSRTRIVKLTEKGCQALEKVLPLWEEAQTCVTNQLGQDRWNDMLGHLSATIALAEKK
ncbi:MAG: MarR family winged helix-turn-helix transcriptional regulator [Candidatus Anammoxibacter sp.]